MKGIVKIVQKQDAVEILVSAGEMRADRYEFRVGYDGLPEIRVLEYDVRISERKSPIEIIGGGLPTFAHCYKNPTEVRLPERVDLEMAASRIIDSLKAAGWNIT